MIFNDVNGRPVQISDEELARVFRGGHQSLAFTIGGKHTMLTTEEMKEIANVYLDQFGKNKMVEFYSHYQKKAAENIQKALGWSDCPKTENDIKESIATALHRNHAELAAEVIFEAMEWETAYSSLESILK